VALNKLEGERTRKESLSPILSVSMVEAQKEGLTLCKQLLSRKSMGHLATIHTRDSHLAERYGLEMAVSRILINSPSSFGYCRFSTGPMPSATLGCAPRVVPLHLTTSPTGTLSTSGGWPMLSEGLQQISTRSDRHCAIHRIASALPFQQTACVTADVLVPALHQQVVDSDAGIANLAGAVDNNLVIPIKALQGILRFVEVGGAGKIKRTRNMLGAILPFTQHKHELEILPSVDSVLQLNS
jgi:hypothetical protein